MAGRAWALARAAIGVRKVDGAGTYVEAPVGTANVRWLAGVSVEERADSAKVPAGKCIGRIAGAVIAGGAEDADDGDDADEPAEPIFCTRGPG